jgi:hypothetical protein
MPRVGLEPTIPAFERPKSVHAFDRATTVIGVESFLLHENNYLMSHTFLKRPAPRADNLAVIYEQNA